MPSRRMLEIMDGVVTGELEREAAGEGLLDSTKPPTFRVTDVLLVAITTCATNVWKI